MATQLAGLPDAPRPLPRVVAIVPALDEEAAIARLVPEFPRDVVAEVIVVDNGSHDGTAAVAEQVGARVVAEPRRGYGRACLAGLRAAEGADVVVYLDGDCSDDPAQIPRLLAPLLRGQADLVVGTRGVGAALPPHQRLGNVLVAWAGVVVVTGTIVTGSGPHAGDEAANRLGFDLESVVRIHGVTVLGFLGLTLLVVRRAVQGDADPAVVRRLQWLVGAIVVQGTIGYAQYFAGVPALLVGLHVLGSALVWIAVLDVRLAMSAPGGGGSGASRARMDTDADRRLTAA